MFCIFAISYESLCLVYACACIVVFMSYLACIE